MNRNYSLVCVGLLAVCSSVASAAPPFQDSVESLLIQPDVVINNLEELNLSEDQLKRIRSEMEAAGPRAQALQKLADQARGQLAETLAADDVDEEAVLKQLDKMLLAEKDQKRLHMQVMIRLRNELTPQQRERAANLQRPGNTDLAMADTQQRLKAKIASIQAEMNSQAQAGNPPFEAQGQLQKFPELMQLGRVHEAEAVLDRVMAALGIEKTSAKQDHDPARDKKDGARSAPRIPKLDPLSPEQVDAQVAAMKKPDVAWRKIAWKTCLLDGLRASRQQQKPIMLWIFIDRPIDDERC